MLATITWVADRGIELGPLFIRYYQVFFFLGFFLGYQWMKKVFIKEGVDLKILDALLSTMVVATVLGCALWPRFFLRLGLLPRARRRDLYAMEGRTCLARSRHRNSYCHAVVWPQIPQAHW